MKRFISFLILSITLTAHLSADVFMTELTDPQNSSDAGRYVELYNNGGSDVDLTGWALLRWTNGNADPQSPEFLTGTISAGGFYIICNNAGKFSTTYGGTCDEDIGTGGPADSNGDDNIALLDDSGAIADMFGVAGEDGSGTGHEFEDGRAERAEGVTAANAIWDVTEWNIDNDSGGGDGNQYAPEGFDPSEWIGAAASSDDGGGTDTCDDESACNTGAESDCEYAENGYDCDGNCLVEVDCADECGGSAVVDECGECGGDGPDEGQDCDGNHVVHAGNMYFLPSELSIAVGATVVWVNDGGTHNAQGDINSVTGESFNNPEAFYLYPTSDAVIGSHTFTVAGNYSYDCSVGNHAANGMVGALTVGTGGCTDDGASNYDSEADFNDGSCSYPAPVANLFFSEAAEGSSNNKYLEIYNASDAAVSLADYGYSNVSNAPTTPGEYEYWNVFEDGAVVEAGDVYVVCHASSDDIILAECDETYTYLSNGDDGFCLVYGSEANYTILDCVGDWGGDPGDGWEVAGVEDATQDHTLVRKSSVTEGTGYDWALSAGTNSDDSEWIVLDQNTWDYIGFHPHDFSTAGCMDETACNYDADATEDDGSCLYNDCLGECGGDAELDDCGECGGDGTSCAVNVTFSVDMSLYSGDIVGMQFRTSTINDEYSPSDWSPMTDAGDGVYSFVTSLSGGVTYGYNFNNGQADAPGYESGTGLGDCAGGFYGNDRYVTPGDADMTLDTVCWESCDACPEIVEGCTDDTATNYDPEATVDDGSCEYEELESANLFISEAAEGSSNNKYIEIYNASAAAVDLGGYAYPTVSNAPTTQGEHEYWNTFADGAEVAAGDVYVVCHGSADDLILAECDETYTFLSNGDDGLCLVFGSEANYTILDCVGDWEADPGSGWEVAGVSSGTKDHTIVRKSSVTQGTGYDWAASAGTNADDSQWEVYDQNTWDYLGFHTMGDIQLDCEDESACNFMEPGDCVYAEENFDCDGNCAVGTDCNGECGGSAIEDECGECGGDGSSCECIPGDVNGNNNVDVTDVVSIVASILDDAIDANLCADMNGSGGVDVLDVVQIVSLILDTRTTSDATEATLNINNGSVSLDANGFVGAVQMTISHDASFDIELTNKAMVADYKTNGNSTTLIIVAPESDDLFNVSGDFSVEEIIVANAASNVSVVMPTEVTLGKAYPNPFNPSTTMSIYVPADGFVSLNVYNVMGQKVDMIHSGNMSEGSHSITWNASSLTSGVYFVRAESTSGIATQKVMLMK